MHKLKYVLISALIVIMTSFSSHYMVLAAPKNSNTNISLNSGSFIFNIEAPSDYKLTERDGPYTKAFAWQGPVRSDGSYPSFGIAILTPPPGETNIPSTETISQTMLDNLKQVRNNFQQSQVPEYFSSKGNKFVKAHWSGIEPERNFPMQGYFCTTTVNNNFVIFSYQDLEQYKETTSKISDKIISSFKVTK